MFRKESKLIIAILLFAISKSIFAISFRVSTWNIQHGKYPHKIEQEIETQLLGNSDVICWQEMKEKSKLAERLSTKYGLYVHKAGSDVIFSKHPFVEAGKIHVRAEGKGRTAAWATINVNGTHVRVYSIHLAYKENRCPFISRIRGEQMQRILDHANKFNGPIIHAGDLNTIGYIIGGQSKEHAIRNLKRDGYSDAFKKFPNINTQRAQHFLRMGKIDWIWYRDTKLIRSVPGRFAKSDHRWLFSEFDI